MEYNKQLNEAYEQGKRDGIASVLKGEPFTRSQIAIYMLMNSGFSAEKLATIFNISIPTINGTYSKVKKHYQEVLITNEQKAIHRLLDVLKHGDEETDGDLF